MLKKRGHAQDEGGACRFEGDPLSLVGDVFAAYALQRKVNAGYFERSRFALPVALLVCSSGAVVKIH